MNRKCECGHRMKIVRETVDDGSKMKVVKRGRGKTKEGEKKKFSIHLIKVIDPETRKRPYVIEARCSDVTKCHKRVIVRGRSKAEARHRYFKHAN